MGKGLISFLIAVSAGTWIYNKFMQRTGSLTERSLIAGGVCGVILFLVAFLILGKLGF